MGKGRHTQDRLFLSATEMQAMCGAGSRDRARAPVRRLPFNHCGLSLTEFGDDSVMTPDGFVYDIKHIVPFLRKYRIHPATGAPLSAKDLVPLRWARNTEGRLACPVTGKVFTDNSRIVALRTTGNVYAADAIDTLCVAPKNWRDLLDDSPFTRADIVTLSDPSDPVWLAAHSVDAFHHVRTGLAAGGGGADDGGGAAAVALPSGAGRMRVSDATKRILADVAAGEAERAAARRTAEASGALPRFHVATPAAAAAAAAAPHVTAYGVRTSGLLGASLTSTGLGVRTKNEAAATTEADARAARWAGVAALRRKALVRLETTEGPLNLELAADAAPRTVENFLLLAARGYYNGCTFHRSIRNFMLQGGDPTGTGTGGDSAWGGAFPDEFGPGLSHDSRGVLSMANSGPNTNRSQFFITYKSCPHLDRKHAVFGRVVGGLDTLRALELVPTDSKTDRPTRDVRILSATVFADPFADYDAGAAERAAAAAASAAARGGVSGSAVVGGGASIAARAASGVSALAPSGRVVAGVAGGGGAAVPAAGETWLQPTPALDATAGIGGRRDDGTAAADAVAAPRPRVPAAAAAAPLSAMLPPVGSGASAPASAAPGAFGSGAGGGAPAAVGRYLPAHALSQAAVAAPRGGGGGGGGAPLAGAAAAEAMEADAEPRASKKPRYGDFSGF